jgi:hypothetical protein
LAIRILFAFDPWRQAVLLAAGNKAGRWNQWYPEAISKAEQLFARWVTDERERREKDGGDGD